MCDVSSSSSWFAVRTKTGLEKAVAAALRFKGFDELLPLYKARRRWSDRTKDVELPLFPGYLFCRVNDSFWLPILKTPGVLHLVSVARKPVPVLPSEIEAIQHIVHAGVRATPHEFLEIDQPVRIDCGPLAGLKGRLVAFHRQQRLVVSVTLLQRSIAVEIERGWIIPLRPCGHESASSVPRLPAAGSAVAPKSGNRRAPSASKILLDLGAKAVDF